MLELLEAIASKLMGTRVRWFTDNQNVVRILQVSSCKPALQIEAVRVFELCVTSQIHLQPEWIPREKNQLADYLSRIIDYDDWYLDPSMFVRLDNLWGPHSVDRFANHSSLRWLSCTSDATPMCCQVNGGGGVYAWQ